MTRRDLVKTVEVVTDTTKKGLSIVQPDIIMLSIAHRLPLWDKNKKIALTKGAGSK
uniref:Uncharacterized protein n=1 Tax=Timema genevievae TaxID=629358 RepID=A0A7R9KAY7_TIMGE|nr:unnamed protein product [Timema genevievae]